MMNKIIFNYLLRNFLKTFFIVLLIFYCFGVILNLFEEIEFFKSKESEVINLGNTIFKSDTASIVGISLLKYLILDRLN